MRVCVYNILRERKVDFGTSAIMMSIEANDEHYRYFDYSKCVVYYYIDSMSHYIICYIS